MSIFDKRDLNEEIQGLKKHKEDKKILMDARDSEYWLAICFQSREQKKKFLAEAGWSDLGDKYLDGMKIADRMGIEIRGMTPQIPRMKKKIRFGNDIRFIRD